MEVSKAQLLNKGMMKVEIRQFILLSQKQSRAPGEVILVWLHSLEQKMKLLLERKTTRCLSSLEGLLGWQAEQVVRWVFSRPRDQNELNLASRGFLAQRQAISITPCVVVTSILIRAPFSASTV